MTCAIEICKPESEYSMCALLPSSNIDIHTLSEVTTLQF